MLISVIITTYNWPKALSLVLSSFLAQTDNNFEIIVADDGSTEETIKVIQAYQNKFDSFSHVWQEDNGFQAAKIRNKAIVKAKGEYIIFIDGDCVVPNDFIKNHRALMKKNYFVSGNRLLLNETFTHEILNKQLTIFNYTFFDWLEKRIAKKINRLLPLFNLPLGSLRKLKLKRWQGAKTCNLAVFKQDLLQVGGFDENFKGWGFEDSDLVLRLIHSGIYRIDGRFKTYVFHLHHKENDKSRLKENLELLHSVIDLKKIKANLGLEQYYEH